MPMQAVLLDFDGTLADSFTAITASTNHVRSLHDLPPLSETEVRKLVGYGLENLLEQVVPNASTDITVEEYRAHHSGVMLTQTKLLPGVRETLTAWHEHGIPLAVCSNKKADFTRQLIDVLGLSAMITAVLGPDDVNNIAKPKPNMLLEALRRLKGSAEQSIFIGDMSIDVNAARAVPMPVWLVLQGSANRDDAHAAKPDRVFEKFAEMRELVLG